MNDLAIALGALSDAIEAGTAIPSEFKVLVDQHLPEGLAKRATYAPRSELFGMMSRRGIINSAIGGGSASIDETPPERSLLEWYGRTQSGRDARSTMPNVYRGALVEGGNAETGQRSPEQPPIIQPGDPEWYRRGT